MKDTRSLQRFLEKALAFAHAALDDPTDEHLANAQRYADEVLPRVQRLKQLEFTLAEARQIVLLVVQLRTVLEAVERRSGPARAATG